MPTFPSFLPRIDNDNWSLRLLRNGDRWLTLLQHTGEGAPDPSLEVTLFRMGFQKGSSGRYFLPTLLNEEQDKVVCRSLGATMDVIDPSKVVYLEGAERVEPALPFELRDSIAWWWANDRKALLNEVRLTIASGKGDHYQVWRDKLTVEQWRNPDRLKGWVDDALNGEISPVTEPILGLGLARAETLYADALPSDLQEWADRLSEFRGEAGQTEPTDPVHSMVRDTLPDQRPLIGARVQWTDGKEALEAGIVTNHSDDDKETIWVMPDRPTYVEGIVIPKRQRVHLSQIANYVRPAEVGVDTKAYVAPSTQTRWLKHETSLDDILSPDIKAFQANGYLNDDAKRMIIGLYKTGKLSGTHPLSIAAGFTKADQFVPHWPFMQSVLNLDMMGDTPEVHDARAFTRDMLLAEFNEAQPEWPEGVEPLLAVIPVSPNVAMASSLMVSEDAQERFDKETVYGIGFHPMFIRKLEDRLEDLCDEIPASHAGMYKQALKKYIQPLLGSNLSLSNHIPGINSIPMRKLSIELGQADREDLREIVGRLTGGQLFSTLEEAQEALRDRFMLGNSAPSGILADNRSTYESLADLSGQSQQYLDRLPHPLCLLVDELTKAGCVPGMSKAELFASLGINLKRTPALTGQIAALAGVDVPLFESVAFSANEPSDQKTVGEASCGILRNLDGERAFAFGAVLKNQDHHVKDGPYRQRQALITDDQNSVFFASGLGHLVELNAMNSLVFSSAVTNTVLKREHIEELSPSWLGASTGVRELDFAFDIGQGITEAGISGAHSLTEVTDQPEVAKAATAAVSQAQIAIMNKADQRWNQREASESLVRASIKVMIAGNKVLKDLASTERVEAGILSTLKDTRAEMLVVMAKRRGHRTTWRAYPVTQKELTEANYDRTAAADIVVYKAKERLGRGWQPSSLDMLSITRPEALAYLNEAKDQEERQVKLEGAGNSVKRGARQSRGVVAGLSAKDLRGKASEVISNLTKATLADQAKAVTKTKLWEAPDWAALRSPEDGSTPMEPMVAAWFSEVRKKLPGKPPVNIEGLNVLFAETMLMMRDGVIGVRTEEQLEEFIKSDLLPQFLKVTKECDQYSVSPKSIIGEFDWAPDYILRTVMQKASRLSYKNSTWPNSLGNSRAAAKRTEKDQTGAMPMLTRLDRVGGEDYRKGFDTDEETLIKTFGFSGIEYGESLPQKERTEYLNYAYDGFMDLSRALGVSPQALSMGGTLGLAFGSRGRGGRNAALAHFEPGNNAINLTRMKGAGSMAHEFGHALANYFARQVTGAARGPGDLSETVSAGGRVSGLNAEKLGGLRKEIYDSFALIMATIKYETNEMTQTELPNLEDFIESYKLRATSFVQGAEIADKKKKEPYWNTPAELFARAFETWTNEALKEKDPTYRNDFLVRPDKLKVWGKSLDQQSREDKGQDTGAPYRAQLYPSGTHLTRVGKAFRSLFDSVLEGTKQVRHEHLGEVDMPFLYSHDTGIQRLATEDMRPLAQCVLNEVVRMCGEGAQVAWQRELRDTEGQYAAARFSVIEGAPEAPGRGVRGLIEIAYNANLTAVYHEAFHYAQEILFTPDEQSRLDRDFQPGSDLHKRLIRCLLEQGKGHLVDHCTNTREAQAYAYQEWVKGSLDLRIEEEPRSAFGQIKNFLGKLFGMSRDVGFTTPESLFQAFYDGRIAAKSNLFDAQSELDTRIEASVEQELATQAKVEDGLAGNSDDEEKEELQVEALKSS